MNFAHFKINIVIITMETHPFFVREYGKTVYIQLSNCIFLLSFRDCVPNLQGLQKQSSRVLICFLRGSFYVTKALAVHLCSVPPLQCCRLLLLPSFSKPTKNSQVFFSLYIFPLFLILFPKTKHAYQIPCAYYVLRQHQSHLYARK